MAANFAVLLLWAFGALCVLIDAPTCGGSAMNILNRTQAAITWPLTAAANAARSSFELQRRQLVCRDGALAMWDLPRTDQK